MKLVATVFCVSALIVVVPTSKESKTLEKTRIIKTGDPEQDKASQYVAAGAARASQRRIMDEAIALHNAEMERWHGTKMSVRQYVPDGQIAIHK